MAELDPELASLRDAAAAGGGSVLVELSPAEARARVVAGNALCSAGPDVRVSDVTLTHEGHSVPARVYGDDAAAGRTTLVYGHGGGWVTGDLDYADELCRFVAHAGTRVVSVDYRLAPEFPFPAAHEDVFRAVLAAASTWGKVGVAGDSAGGGLVAAATRAAVDMKVHVEFQVLIYPVLDTDRTRPSYLENARAFPIGAAEMAWFFDHYADEAARQDPRMQLARGDGAGLPPTFVIASGHDPLRDEAAAYVELLRRAGTEARLLLFPSMCHGYLRFTAAAARARAARDVTVRLITRLSSGQPADQAGDA